MVRLALTTHECSFTIRVAYYTWGPWVTHHFYSLRNNLETSESPWFCHQKGQPKKYFFFIAGNLNKTKFSPCLLCFYNFLRFSFFKIIKEFVWFCPSSKISGLKKDSAFPSEIQQTRYIFGFLIGFFLSAILPMLLCEQQGARRFWVSKHVLDTFVIPFFSFPLSCILVHFPQQSYPIMHFPQHAF